jgi:hypothetical protein
MIKPADSLDLPVEVGTVVEPAVVIRLDVKVDAGAVVIKLEIEVDTGAVVIKLDVRVDTGAVVVVPVRSEQIPLFERRDLGYSTLGSPFDRVTVRPPPESVVYAVQLITSTSAWFGSKPVADEESVTVADDEAPTLVNTPTT